VRKFVSMGGSFRQDSCCSHLPPGLGVKLRMLHEYKQNESF